MVKLDARYGQTHRQFTLYKVLTVPANITKGANALRTSTSTYQQKSLTFSVAEFEPSMFYPPVNKQRKGMGRDLPLANDVLREVLVRYVQHRLDTDVYVKPTDPLFLSQRKRFYSPNSRQEHMALMLRGCAGVEKAKSHSGRSGVATHIIHDQGKSLKLAQEILGHKNAATTVIYEQLPEG